MRWLFVTICAFMLAVGLLAQGDRGTITGTVTDPTGATVPAAKVVLRNTETGAVAETVTTETGNYTVPALPMGAYEVSVEAAGFKKTTRTGVRVQVAQTFRVDIGLQLGATTESVTVTAETPLLRTENAEQSMNVSGKKFNELPLNFGANSSLRDWMSFMVLAPGVNGAANGTGESLSTSMEYASVNGMPGGMFKILVEGQDVTSTNDTRWTSTVAASSVEAIGEFSLQTSNFSAQYAGGVGAQLNFTTKSGTNKIHGSLYDYMTNETVFNAHRFFQAGNPRSRDRKTDAGGTIGGPVYIPKIYDGRDKTFFFFNLEIFRNKPMTYGNFQTVPTAAFRTGDFSRALGPQMQTGASPNQVNYFDGLGRAVLQNMIYDPNTERTVNGLLFRDPFSNNTIPTNRLDPVALKIQNLIPLPQGLNAGELYNNYMYDLPNPRSQNLPSFKVDHSFSQAMKLAFYYSHQSTHDIGGGNDGLPDPITAIRDKTAVSNTYQLNWDQSIRPTLLVHVGAGFMRFHNPDSSSQAVLNYDAVKNLGLLGATRDPAGFPRIYRPEQRDLRRHEQQHGTHQRQLVLQRQGHAEPGHHLRPREPHLQAGRKFRQRRVVRPQHQKRPRHLQLRRCTNGLARAAGSEF